MLTRRRGLIFAPFLFMFLACSQSSAQSPKDAEAMRKELEALKAQQAEMQKSLEEIREFLRAATGGRFGAPSLVNSTFDISGLPARGDAKAPVTLIEVSDYHCPFCRRHVQQTQPRIYSELVDKGKVRHVFVHYPIAQLHPDALPVARSGALRQRSGQVLGDAHQAVRHAAEECGTAHGPGAGDGARRDRVPRVPRLGQARQGGRGERRSHLEDERERHADVLRRAHRRRQGHHRQDRRGRAAVRGVQERGRRGPQGSSASRVHHQASASAASRAGTAST